MREVLSSVLFAWAATELVLRARQRGRQRRRTGFRFDRSYPVILVCIGGGVALAFRASHLGSTTWGGGWAPFGVGLAILVAGASFRIWAIVTLGRFFTPIVTIQEGHRLVERGPYRIVRHPSYTGGLIGFLGLGIALGSWLSVLAAVLLPLVGVLVRIHVEEAALIDGLGDEYREYAARTKRLVPGVW